jgi:hypothetical protein
MILDVCEAYAQVGVRSIGREERNRVVDGEVVYGNLVIGNSSGTRRRASSTTRMSSGFLGTKSYTHRRHATTILN